VAKCSVEDQFDDVITYAVNEYGDHRHITRPKVIRWLTQFPAAHQQIAAKVLRSIDYYADNNIHAMAKSLAATVYAEYNTTDKRRIWFVPIGDAGSGAQQVARHLRTVRGVPKTCVVDLLTLHRGTAAEGDVVVAFDDFSGTGQAIRDWWDINETLVRPKQANLVLGVLVLNHKARKGLEEITDLVMSVEELHDEANVFHQACCAFRTEDKNALLELCRMTGCRGKYLK